MKLIAHAYIDVSGAYKNHEQVVDCSTLDANEVLKYCYTQLGIEYPKFYKMDVLSKLGIIGNELLKDDYQQIDDIADSLSLIMANAASSQVTDLKYIDSYTEQKNPSPSLFVYTLPNILTGELAIRNKWYGENAFYICEKLDPSFFQHQLNYSFSRGNTGSLCGWVEAAQNGEMECFLFLISNEEGTFQTENLITIINTYRNE